MLSMRSMAFCGGLALFGARQQWSYAARRSRLTGILHNRLFKVLENDSLPSKNHQSLVPIPYARAKCYTTRNIMRPPTQLRSPMRYLAVYPTGAEW